MEILYNKGILLRQGEYSLYLDPTRVIRANDNTLTCISHAHSDHIANHKSKVLMTEATESLIPYNLDSVNIGYNEEYEFDGMTIEALNANHIMGSSQFLIDDGKERVVYTGDFRLNEGIFQEKCAIPEVDTVIIESTYGKPIHKFPEPYDVYSDIKKWLHSNEEKSVLFAAYALGKSQELIRLLNEDGITPLVNYKTAIFNNSYINNGKKLDYIEITSEEGQEQLHSPFIAILPRSLVRKDTKDILQHQTKSRVLSAVVTGWSTLFSFASFGIDNSFPLSDHANFEQLLRYVEESGAKKVFTVHGYDKELAKHIKKRLNIDSRPLDNAQRSLMDFN